MRPMLRVLGALLLLTACDSATRPPADEVYFNVSPKEVVSGDPLIATLQNRTDVRVVLDFCYMVIQRRGANGWPADPRLDGAPTGLCGPGQHVLLPGETHRRVAPFPRALDTGNYRLWLHVEIGVTDAMVMSPEFRVQD